MSTYRDLGENSIALKLYQKYCRYGVSLQGLQLLARRALARGYPEVIVVHGLEEVIKKNYIRELYHGNDALDEKRYISDVAFRAIMKWGSADEILCC